MKFSLKTFFSFFFLYLAILIGSQRYLLPDVYNYSCFFVFVFAFLTKKQDRISLIVISYLLLVDTGAHLFNVTNGVIRYLIYCITFLFIIYNSKFHLKKLFLGLIIFVVYIIFSILNYNLIESETLKRDILIMIVTISIISISSSRLHYEFNNKLIISCIMVFIFGEILNIIFYMGWPMRHYLSYDSGKVLIVFPLVFYFIEKKYEKLLLVFPFIFLVLLFYGSRMILVALIIGVLLYLISNNKKSIMKFVLGGIICFFTIRYLSNAYEDIFQANRMTALIYDIVNFNSISNLDPVRFSEAKLFFSQPFYNILFGNGLGTGLFDSNGLLSFVKPDEAAFTREELKSRIFYNFHDIYTDVGLRFGLIFLFVAYFYIIKGFPKKNVGFFSVMLFIIMTSTFYSMKGLLLVLLFSMLYKFYTPQNEIH